MSSQTDSAPTRAASPWPARTRVSRTELDPTSFLDRTATIEPDRTAVVDGQVRRSYAQLHERVNRLASALRARGLERHGRVAALCPNVAELMELHHAVPAAGGVLVAINVRLSAAEVRYILEHSGSRMLFVDPDLEPLASDAPADLDIVRLGDEYERLLACGDPAGVPSLLRDEEEPIAIDYTSGTTGRPKGVVYTYRGAYLNALGEVIEAELGHHPVYLWTLPMFHCNGWCFPWAVTAAAGTHVCLRAVDPDLIWRLLREERVTHYCGSPTVHGALVNHPDAGPLDHRVTALVAAAPPSPTLLARMEALNIRIVHVYGLTETYGPHTVRMGHDGWDDNNVMAGYFADDDATETAFRGGWFHSGDLAVWHPDNAIELRDRGKDIIISGGENISSIEVEQAICAHPAVLEAAVVAVPHNRWGERPKAFVTVRPGAEVGEQELIGFCRERLAHFKCPDAIAFGPLPKTSTGKVQKVALREPEWAGRERRIN
jgi:fatty-acyl-CoA synthase